MDVPTIFRNVEDKLSALTKDQGILIIFKFSKLQIGKVPTEKDIEALSALPSKEITSLVREVFREAYNTDRVLAFSRGQTGNLVQDLYSFLVSICN